MIVICPSLSGCYCTRIDPGHVGITVNYAGSNRGVDDIPQVTGWVFYNVFTETVLEFPVYVQTSVWSSSPHEGSPNNEEITFNSKKGMAITADISLSYRLDPAKVPAFYQKFRTDNLVTFSHGFLRNVARDAFGEIASEYETEEIYGQKKAELLDRVKKSINKNVNPIGIIIEQFGFIGAIRLPQNVIDSLNASQGAIQRSIQAENEIRQTRAEAKKKVAVAEGEALSLQTRTKAEAEARLVAAKAEAEANLLLSKSLTPELIKLKMVNVLEKWDGHRPSVESSGNSGFLFQLPPESSLVQK